MNNELHNLENDFNRSRDLSLINCLLVAETIPHVDGAYIVTTFSKYHDDEQYIICCIEDNHDMRILLDRINGGTRSSFAFSVEHKF